jgi:signal transduction histidine kinase
MNTKSNDKSEKKDEIIRLKEDNKKFQEEIKRLEQSLVNVNKKLEDAEALKSHFISNICNEIVNPFTSVLALAESILSVDKENWKKVISMVAMIHSEVFHLDFQLKNIFAAAKIEAGDLTPEVTTVDIVNLLKNVIDTFKYDIRHKRLDTKLLIENQNANTKIFFNTDSEKLNLIISNLVSNAIKFSRSKGEILVKVTRAFNKLILEVQDFGSGISAENESIIFDRFKRIDSGINSINRGHGLGLSINKAILEILDGTISFTSKINEGTTFIVTLPESTQESKGISSDSNELFFKEEKF